MEGTTLVLSPLKALMRDQVAALQRLKLPATFINGDIGQSEKKERYELLEAGVFKFLYLAPERFNNDRVRPEEVTRLCKLRPRYLVVDEAHCVNRWGDDFRPDYGRLRQVREKLGNPPVLAFTATAGARCRPKFSNHWESRRGESSLALTGQTSHWSDIVLLATSRAALRSLHDSYDASRTARR